MDTNQTPDQAQEYSTQEVAATLGVHPNTVYDWTRAHGVSVRVGSKNRKFYSAEALAVLLAVKESVGAGNGHATTRRKLGLDEPVPTEARRGPDVLPADYAVPTADTYVAPPAPAVDLEPMAQLIRELSAQAAMAAVWQERAQNLQDQVKLLSAPAPPAEPPRPWWHRLFSKQP
jgi:transposase-like protein